MGHSNGKITAPVGLDSDVYPSNMEEAIKIRRDVAIKGARLLLIKQKHF